MKDVKILIDGKEFTLGPRSFKKSGRKGYGLYGKIMIRDETYQASINLVKLEVK